MPTTWRITPEDDGSAVVAAVREDFKKIPVGDQRTITRDVAGVPTPLTIASAELIVQRTADEDEDDLFTKVVTVVDSGASGTAELSVTLEPADLALAAPTAAYRVAVMLSDGSGPFTAAYGGLTTLSVPIPDAVSGAGVVPLLVFDGDSITTNDYTSNPWHWQTRVELIDTYPELAFEEFGVSGQTYTNMYADAASQIDPLVDPVAYTHNVLVAMAGANDIVPDSPTAAEDAHDVLVLYGQARQAAGWTFVVCTMLPRTAPIPGSKSFAQYELDRLEFNQLIRDNWATYADALCDLAATAPFDSPESIGGGAALPTSAPGPYLVDGVHPNNAGSAVMAERLVPVLEAILV